MKRFFCLQLSVVLLWLAAPGSGADEPALPTLTLPAATFRSRPVGLLESNGWNICVNGYIRHTISFSSNGMYNLVIVARGEPADSQWPIMQINLDDQPLHQIEVADPQWMPYSFSASVSSGLHELAIGFINDAKDLRNQDRNLHLSTVTLVAPTSGIALASATDVEHDTWQTNRVVQWNNMLDDQIRRHRQGRLVIWTTGDHDEPLTNAALSIRQIRHEFLFGTALASDMFATNAPEEAATYLDHAARYFNSAVTENAMKWPILEPSENQPDYELLDRMAAWCRSNSIALRGHCLFWGCEVPAWAQILPVSNLWDAMEQRTWRVMNRYTDSMTEFDILNEPLHCPYFKERLGDPGLRAMFNWAREAAPRAGRYINDYGVLEGYEIGKYMALMGDLLKAQAGVNGIGVQAHFEKDADPHHVHRVLEQLSTFRLPIKITELDCSDEDEAVRVRCVSNVMKVAFATPAVDGILLWGFWEKRHWRPASALFKTDFTSTALGNYYQQTIFSNWWTRAAGFSDAVGRFEIPAFYGDYIIEASSPDGRYTNLNARLSRSEGSTVITLQFGDTQAARRSTPAAASP